MAILRGGANQKDSVSGNCSLYSSRNDSTRGINSHVYDLHTKVMGSLLEGRVNGGWNDHVRRFDVWAELSGSVAIGLDGHENTLRTPYDEI